MNEIIEIQKSAGKVRKIYKLSFLLGKWNPYLKIRVMSKFWGLQKRFCRSPNSLCMGFTFLMDANTSKYFLKQFYGNEANYGTVVCIIWPFYEVK